MLASDDRAVTAAFRGFEAACPADRRWPNYRASSAAAGTSTARVRHWCGFRFYLAMHLSWYVAFLSWYNPGMNDSITTTPT
jgi:hypothetical protein